MLRKIGIGLLLLVLVSGAAFAEDDLKGLLEKAQKNWADGKNLEAIGALDEAMSSLWQKTDFQIPVVVITESTTEGFGMFQARKDNVFKKDAAKVLLYMEPVGYKYAPEGKDAFKFGFSMDLYLLDPQQKVVFNKENFLNQELVSHRKNREFFLNVTLNLTGLDKGEYTIKLVTRDPVGKQQTETKVPVQITD